MGSPLTYGMDGDGDRLVVVRQRGRRAETVLDTGAGLGDRAAVQAALTAAVARGRAELAVAAGANESVLRRLTAPLAAPDKARRVLPSLLDVELAFPLDRCVHAFTGLTATPGGQTEALAVAVRLEEWTALLQRAQDALVEPTQVDHEALALWDQAQREDAAPATAGARAILHVATDHLTCVVGAGERLLAAPVARRAAGEPPASVLPRLLPVLRAVIEPGAASGLTWLLAGRGLGADDAIRALQQALPDGGAARSRVARDPGTFLARALARRAAGGGSLPCNLRQGAHEHAARVQRRARGLARAQWTALAAGLLLLAASLGGRGWLERRTEAAREALNREAVQLTGLSRVPRGQELELARRALADRARLQDPFLAGVRDSTLELITRLLAAAREAEARVEKVSIEGSAFELAGRGADWAAGERLVANLARQGWNSELTRGEAGAGETVPFTVKGSR